MTVVNPALITQLNSYGAGKIEHLGGSLLEHLISTHDQLHSWGNPRYICEAGLFHAAYSTEAFGKELIPTSQRDQLAKSIGAKSEALAYLYGACDRNWLYPQIGNSIVTYKNRFTGIALPITKVALAELLEITVANELDVAEKNPKMKTNERQWFVNLFASCEAFVSERANAAYKNSFGINT